MVNAAESLIPFRRPSSKAASSSAPSAKWQGLGPRPRRVGDLGLSAITPSRSAVPTSPLRTPWARLTSTVDQTPWTAYADHSTYFRSKSAFCCDCRHCRRQRFTFAECALVAIGDCALPSIRRIRGGRVPSMWLGGCFANWSACPVPLRQ